MRLALAVLLAAALASCGHDDSLEPLPIAAAPSTSTRASAMPVETTTTTAAPIAPPAEAPRPSAPGRASVPRPSRSIDSPRPPAERPASEVVEGWRSLGVFSSTCYELRGTTASGRPAGPGSIAVDPTVIRLGMRLRVEGYGEGIAADTGGAIKGRIVDVWKASGCREWGRRNVEVFVADG